MSDHPSKDSKSSTSGSPAASAPKKAPPSTEERLTTLEQTVNSMRGVPMGEPPIELLNTEVMSIPIAAATQSNKAVGLPPGDTFTATSSDPYALSAGIGVDKGGGPALVVRPMQPEAPHVSASVTDSMGLQSDSLNFKIVTIRETDKPPTPPGQENPAPAKLVLDVDKATTEAQVAPTKEAPHG